jgi:KaiC/GvpD/RAD55 family RecA-like ATPase
VAYQSGGALGWPRKELAILDAGIEALGRGEGAVVWVEGEPGIGKSSLAAQALAAASQPGWDVG